MDIWDLFRSAVGYKSLFRFLAVFSLLTFSFIGVESVVTQDVIIVITDFIYLFFSFFFNATESPQLRITERVVLLSVLLIK